MQVLIRLMQAEDVAPIVAAFQAIGWNKPAAQYERYLGEQQRGQRTALLALADASFAGYLTICWSPDYPPFRSQGIPEIQDFNVLPQLRRRGIGGRLMDAAERRVKQRTTIVGIGVGLYADYGAAQRLYVRRGFIPDGRGVMYRGQPVAPGQSIPVDDELALYFTKQL
jgi:GNAT superfamily N-acetyltransferase